MIDKARLKELLRSLDVNNLDSITVEAVDEIVDEMLADAYEDATGGNQSTVVYHAGVVDEIHQKWFRVKSAHTPTWERQSLINDILRLLE